MGRGAETGTKMGLDELLGRKDPLAAGEGGHKQCYWRISKQRSQAATQGGDVYSTVCCVVGYTF